MGSGGGYGLGYGFRLQPFAGYGYELENWLRFRLEHQLRYRLGYPAFCPLAFCLGFLQHMQSYIQPIGAAFAY